MRRLGCGGCGCLVALLAPALLAAALVFTLVSAISQVLVSLNPFARGGALAGVVPVQPLGPAYYATTGGRPTLHDLGFGPSDPTRIEALIRGIRPDSPLVGQGAIILRLGQQYGVDPLLIALWQAESQLCTDGLNTPKNGNWNCGNLIWEAAQPYAARWGCTPGGTSLNHRWALCPTAEGGLGIWFEYVGRSPVYAAAVDLYNFANIYNPCSDPGNAANGFPCGNQYAMNILAAIGRAAGPPVAYQAPPPSVAGAADPGLAAQVLALAAAQQGKPYVWGGASPQTSFDCSGLMQWVYRQAGVELPRTAQQQYDATPRVAREQLAPGDLVFFANTYKNDPSEPITHVGIYLGGGRMINAPQEGQPIGEMDVFSGFWGAHFASGGRVRAGGR